MSRICVAVISYKPDKDALVSLLLALISKSNHLLLVENASLGQEEIDAIAAAVPDLTILPQLENIGIAGGINVALRWARDQGCQYLIPLDQDSVPARDMIPCLLEAYEALVKLGLPVAAVGPQQVNIYNGQPAPFIRFRLPVKQQLWGSDLPHDCVECDFLVSSGSLLPMTLLDSLGGMDETLFIDNVDLEWCFRVRSKGYRLYGCFTARMEHQIGEQDRHFAGVTVREHQPLRQYYITRNRLTLYFRLYTPWVWIVLDVPRLILKVLYLALLAERRGENCRMVAAAVRDVICRRKGRIQKTED